jgi:hypothetical protein
VGSLMTVLISMQAIPTQWETKEISEMQFIIFK